VPAAQVQHLQQQLTEVDVVPQQQQQHSSQCELEVALGPLTEQQQQHLSQVAFVSPQQQQKKQPPQQLDQQQQLFEPPVTVLSTPAGVAPAAAAGDDGLGASGLPLVQQVLEALPTSTHVASHSNQPALAAPAGQQTAAAGMKKSRLAAEQLQVGQLQQQVLAQVLMQQQLAC
jgi:hypothetical protein